MDEITLAQQEQHEKRINELVKEAIQLFDEWKGKDISRLSVVNRDKYIQGRVASDLEVSDQLLLMLRQVLALYEAHLHRETNTAALLFLINGIKAEVQVIDVVAKIENRPIESQPDE